MLVSRASYSLAGLFADADAGRHHYDITVTHLILHGLFVEIYYKHLRNKNEEVKMKHIFLYFCCFIYLMDQRQNQLPYMYNLFQSIECL